MSGSIHSFRATCTWAGTTAVGVDEYDRTHTASTPPAGAGMTLSADPVFHGDPELPNPEQLLVLAAASCQLLSFLAVAARARVDVVGYHDDAEGVMPEDDRPMRITRIVLRPQISVVGDVDTGRLTHLCEVAHEHCFIANSLSTDVVVEPTFTHVPAG